jgi:RNA polymerase sigma-70 factor (ECF subfamily)
MIKGNQTKSRELHERRLFMRLCEGDLAAFETFCTALEAPILSYLQRLVHNRSEAEDLAQESFLRLYKMARDGRIRVSDGSPRSLVFRIAHNLAMDYFRKARFHADMALAPCPPATRNAERALLREQIDLALSELPPDHRAAIMLREFGELSYAEISATLDASLDQVKVWIYRARKRLACLLDRDGQYLGEGTADVSRTIDEALGDMRHGS